ncbi:MAG TPA: helix-turn-helix transcriptional regulator [Chitinophagales bacterium]|nr:helix-turn-helix transcriptional regulator [Chitinophagales bacterium]
MSDEQYLIEIGRKIRDRRKEKKMSQDEVAALCDIEKANLSRIENGKTNSTILTFRKISLVLFNHTSELFLD